ncbi:MAG: hypothetical protein QNJ64_00595 [Crocosphaera sp.]|nr:hypothetical protein [Crocosphaera sp.]
MSIDKQTSNKVITENLANQPQEEKILCPHCKRTASNGIKCKGICVADDDY